MPNIAETAPVRNPRSVNDRRSQQTARPGWRPRKCSPEQRATYIAESIIARITEGRTWSFAEYGLEDKPDMIDLVMQHLPTKTPQEIDALKRQWLMAPYFLIEDTEGFEVHRAELLEFRLTQNAWATAHAQATVRYVASEWGVSEQQAAQIEAKRLVAHFLGWSGRPIDSDPQTVAGLAQALVNAATQQ